VLVSEYIVTGNHPQSPQSGFFAKGHLQKGGHWQNTRDSVSQSTRSQWQDRVQNPRRRCHKNTSSLLNSSRRICSSSSSQCGFRRLSPHKSRSTGRCSHTLTTTARTAAHTIGSFICVGLSRLSGCDKRVPDREHLVLVFELMLCWSTISRSSQCCASAQFQIAAPSTDIILINHHGLKCHYRTFLVTPTRA
jgi:hypothetical protein